jgi:uncharacterized Rmd1/YagE family protein
MCSISTITIAAMPLSLSYGVLVVWGMTLESMEVLFKKTKPFEEGKHHQTFTDEFTFITTGTIGIKDDVIFLASDDVMEKLAISHGIAQSVKLQEFEIRAQSTIEDTVHIPKNIAQSGKTYLSRKQISKMRGNLYLVKSDINLRYDLLDTPEFFWEYPEVERPYELMAKYLDVRSRIEILNKKLEVIHELFSMLADEQNHKHAFALEWIIILLIAIEIFMFLFLEIFKLF